MLPPIRIGRELETVFHVAGEVGAQRVLLAVVASEEGIGGKDVSGFELYAQ